MRWKSKEYDIWHSHFALKPVRVKGEWVWLERVIRRGQRRTFGGKTFWEWTYINSEFDLIKMNESESAMQESSTQNVAKGQIASPNYVRSLTTINTSKGLQNANSIY